MRTLRTALAVLLFLATLALLLAGALMLYITPDRLTQRIDQALEARLGLRAELSGPVEVKRLPKLIIRIPAGTLSRTADSQPAGKFDSAEIELAPWSIFAVSPRLDRVAVTGLALESLGRKPEAPAGKDIWNIGLIELAGASMPISVPELGAGTVTALDARLSEMSETGFAAQLAGNIAFPAANAADAAQESAAAVSGAFTFAGAIALDPASDALSASSPAVTFSGFVRGRTFKASASAEMLTTADRSLWSAERVQAECTLSENGNPLSVNFPRLAATPAGIQAERAEFSAGIRTAGLEGMVNGSGALSWNWKASSFELKSLDLATAAAGSSADSSSRLTGSFSLSPAGMQTDLEGQLFGSPARLRLQNASGSLALGEVSLPALAQASELMKPLLAALPPNASAALSVSRLRLSDSSRLAIESFTGDLTRSGDALSLSRGQGTLFAGKVQLAAFAEAGEDWQANLTLRGADAAAAGFAPIASGKLSGSADLSGTLSADDGAPALSAMKGELRIENGTLAGIDIPGAHRILAEEAPEAMPPEVTGKAAVTPFAHARMELRREGAAALRITGEAEMPATAEQTGWRGAFAGELAGGNLKADASFTLPARGKVPELTLPAQVSVPAGKPLQWTVNWLTAAAPAIEAHADDAVTLRGIGQRIERAVKDFWNGIELPKMPWESDEPAAPVPQQP